MLDRSRRIDLSGLASTSGSSAAPSSSSSSSSSSFVSVFPWSTHSILDRAIREREERSKERKKLESVRRLQRFARRQHVRNRVREDMREEHAKIVEIHALSEEACMHLVSECVIYFSWSHPKDRILLQQATEHLIAVEKHIPFRPVVLYRLIRIVSLGFQTSSAFEPFLKPLTQICCRDIRSLDESTIWEYPFVAELVSIFTEVFFELDSDRSGDINSNGSQFLSEVSDTVEKTLSIFIDTLQGSSLPGRNPRLAEKTMRFAWPLLTVHGFFDRKPSFRFLFQSPVCLEWSIRFSLDWIVHGNNADLPDVVERSLARSSVVDSSTVNSDDSIVPGSMVIKEPSHRSMNPFSSRQHLQSTGTPSHQMVKTNPFSTSSFSAVGFPSRAGGLFGTGGSNPFSSGTGVSVKLASVGGQSNSRLSTSVGGKKTNLSESSTPTPRLRRELARMWLLIHILELWNRFVEDSGFKSEWNGLLHQLLNEIMQLLELCSAFSLHIFHNLPFSHVQFGSTEVNLQYMDERIRNRVLDGLKNAFSKKSISILIQQSRENDQSYLSVQNETGLESIDVVIELMPKLCIPRFCALLRSILSAVGSEIDVHDLSSLRGTSLLPFLNEIAFTPRLVFSLAESCIRLSAFDILHDISKKTAESGDSSWLQIGGIRSIGSLRKQSSRANCGKAVFLLEGIVLVLSIAFQHALHVVDDDELLRQETILPRIMLRQLTRDLVNLLHAMLIHHPSIFDSLVVDSVLALVTNLYNRNLRNPFVYDEDTTENWNSMLLHKSNLISDPVFSVHASSADQILRCFSSTGFTDKHQLILEKAPFLIGFSVRASAFETYLSNPRDLRFMWDRNPIRIRREYVLEDAFSAMENMSPEQLAGDFHVTFYDEYGNAEPGVGDGIYKEFIVSVTRFGFNPEYGLFLPTNENTLYPNPFSSSINLNHLLHFRFLGILVGKALVKKILLEVPLALFFLKLLLKMPNYFDDMPSYDAELYANLLKLKHFDGNVEDWSLTFSIVQEEFGQIKTIELLPNGHNLSVTNNNRAMYIQLVAHMKLNVLIREQTNAFLEGLCTVLPWEILRTFDPMELSLLISGARKAIDVDDLQRNTVYRGYASDDVTIELFWEVVRSLDPHEQDLLLQFVSSVSKPPLFGFSQLSPLFTIVRSEEPDRLPRAATCVNMLRLPPYETKEEMFDAIQTAIHSCDGFGFL